jgi:predicted  nucleic acid-binding Zn-ribbon protein
MSDLYDRDFYAWANEQAGLLREGRLSGADIANIAEEIETLGRNEKRELRSRLSVLFLHLLKWRHQPSCRSRSWELSITNARNELAEHLADSPSLRATLPEALVSAYRRARLRAEQQTGLPTRTFPAECPWTFDQAMTEELPGSVRDEP